MKTLTSLKTLTLSILLTSLPVSGFARPGGSDGSGGNVVKCALANGQSTYQTLDLYLAENAYGLKVLKYKPGTNYSQLIEKRLNHLTDLGDLKNYRVVISGVRTDVDYTLGQIGELAKLILSFAIPTNQPLKELEDFSLPIKLPSHCKVVQAINYLSDDSILKDERILNKLDDLNLTALKYHEAFYRVFRGFLQDKNSNRTMKLIAKLFEENLALEPVYEGIPTNAYSCSTYNTSAPIGKHQISTRFFVWKDTQERTQIQLTWINSTPVFSKKTVSNVSGFENIIDSTNIKLSPINIHQNTESKFESYDNFELTVGQGHVYFAINPGDKNELRTEANGLLCYPIVKAN